MQGQGPSGEPAGAESSEADWPTGCQGHQRDLRRPGEPAPPDTPPSKCQQTRGSTGHLWGRSVSLLPPQASSSPGASIPGRQRGPQATAEVGFAERGRAGAGLTGQADCPPHR